MPLGGGEGIGEKLHAIPSKGAGTVNTLHNEAFWGLILVTWGPWGPSAWAVGGGRWAHRGRHRTYNFLQLFYVF